MVEIPVAVPPPPNAPAPRKRSRLLLGATVIAAVLGLSAGALRLSIQTPQSVPQDVVESSAPAEPTTQQAALTPAPEEATPAETPSEAASVETPPVDREAVEALRSAMQDTMRNADEPSPSAQFAAAPDPSATDAPSSETPPVAEAAPAAPVQTVPLPVARPPQFRSPVVSDQPRRARQPRRANVAAVAPPPAEDTRSFFEKFFGVQSPPPAQAAAQTPALAYAALSTPAVKPTPPVALSPAPVPPSASGGTAIYDISARIVTLPNGERLEAHSGLGSLMDDARYVNLPSRGPTPPGTYDLTEREAPFHGVRAIRLTPVGGSGAVYNRVGLLAHHYLRGPSGESSGCVSLKHYDRFLQAYLRGEIARLVVVPGRSDSLPAIVNRAFGGNG